MVCCNGEFRQSCRIALSYRQKSSCNIACRHGLLNHLTFSRSQAGVSVVGACVFVPRSAKQARGKLNATSTTRSPSETRFGSCATTRPSGRKVVAPRHLRTGAWVSTWSAVRACRTWTRTPVPGCSTRTMRQYHSCCLALNRQHRLFIPQIFSRTKHI